MLIASIYNEYELLQRIAEGDEQAFAQIVTNYTPQLYHQILIFLKDVHRAEELTQDVFLRVWRNRSKLSQMENFPGYLHVITRNRIRTTLAQMAGEHEILPEDRLHTFLQAPDQIRIELKQLKEEIDRGIALLPPRRKEVFILSRIHSKSYDEIAVGLSISRSAVKQHIIAALVFLRTHIQERTGIIVSLHMIAFSTAGELFLNFF